MAKYPLSDKDREYLKETFTYHAPNTGQQETYKILRSMGKEIAKFVLQYCPPSRERSLALTHIQQAIMWGNASVAINEKEEPKTETAVESAI